MLEIQKNISVIVYPTLYIYYSADALYKIQLFLIHDISLSFIAKKKISVGSQDHTDIYSHNRGINICDVSFTR